MHPLPVRLLNFPSRPLPDYALAAAHARIGRNARLDNDPRSHAPRRHAEPQQSAREIGGGWFPLAPALSRVQLPSLLRRRRNPFLVASRILADHVRTHEQPRSASTPRTSRLHTSQAVSSGHNGQRASGGQSASLLLEVNLVARAAQDGENGGVTAYAAPFHRGPAHAPGLPQRRVHPSRPPPSPQSPAREQGRRSRMRARRRG